MSTPNKPDPQKVAFLRSLPEEIKAQITGEEAQEFISGDYLPESLYEKIKHLLEEPPETSKE